MADKLTQQITDALSRAASEPNGLPLYSSKADPGLFPNSSAARPAAQKCLADALIRVVAPTTGAKPPRDLYALTEKGWEFLLAAVNPKQVLEDFVRVLEARQGEVGELLATARRMADSLQGLKDAVARVLPSVCEQRVERATLSAPRAQLALSGIVTGDATENAMSQVVLPHTSTLVVEKVEEGVDLAPAILAYLADRTGATDCPLPELFRALALTDSFTIGTFHDCLRKLHADSAVTLSAWTGPLYALPEPQFALMIGHSVAYFASLRG